ncbi:MAG: PAS domain S-box protein, partial [Candidatus Omnitrophica bacterium]|nr:PAS domain S-box protein [Candidatus Omnitrophota bacterium]
MVNVYFFYGLAFILMGLFIFVIPKKQDLLGLSDNLWLVGLFGLLHGLNEWADLFILKGEPFDIEGLKTIGTFLLPISFIFLVIFGARVIVKNNNKLQWLNFLWAVCALIWAGAYFFTKDTVVFGAVARYFICIPGTLLTAFALHLSIKQVDKHVIPRVVILEISIVVFTIVAYGILSGFIVPKAEFFPASVVNYSSFSNLIGLPVQFFRMICAIIIAICLFGITKYYFFKEDRIKIRGGIGSKTAVLIITVAVFVMSISTILGYMTETKLLRKTIGLDHQEIARLISISITKNFNEEIEDIRIIISDPAWKNAIAEHNLKYTEMRPEDVNSYFIDMDKRWIDVSLDSSLTKEYLENEASIELKIAIENAINIKELFITDSFGGLVATSGKTSDFYQADKEWWKFAFNKDKIYVGNLEFDESADIMAIAIAVPIKDDKEKIIGVAKAILSGKELFSFLDDFKIGESGHAVVVDQDGYAIYHHELKTLEEERFYKHENVLNKSEKWFELKAPHDHGNNLFVAYAEITQHNFLENGHKWRVFIDQDTDEVLKPLKELAVKRFLPMLGLIMFLIPIGFVYGRIFTKPIIELSKIAEDIGKGNLDVRADVNTSDELEDLANSFNMMIKNLKISTTSIENLNKEIGERKLVEAALSESEEKFRALYEYSNDAIMILASPDWRFISGNSATIKMFGVENEAEFVSMGLWELSPKYQPEGQLSSVKSMAMIKEALTCGSKFFEWKHKRLNGSEFFATVLLTKMQLGDIETVQATVRDITERKKAEKENQELLHFLNERVKEIKCLYDISKLFEIPNITLEDIFQGSVDRISYGWQYPKITCARLTVEGKEFKSDNFKVTKWKQSENIVLHGNKIGVVEVF